MKIKTVISSVTSTLAVCLLLGAGAVSELKGSESWPHWLGPQGNNRVMGAGFETDLSRYKVAWETQIGLGYSSVIVADGRAYTMGHDGMGNETVYCFNARTGDVNWKASYPAKLIDTMHGGGPNASATVQGNRVLTVSKDGQVFYWSADKGEKKWSANLNEILGIKTPTWGFASSPVIYKGNVLLVAGKAAALDVETGQVVWVSQEAYHPGYTTAVVFQHGGKDYIAALGGKELTILSAGDGSEVARHPFKAQYDMVATTPVVLDGGKRLMISGNLSSEMLSFDGSNLSQLWVSKEIRNAMNNSVIVDGVAYGIDGKHGSRNSRLVAVNMEDGQVKWVKEGFGYGNTIGVGNSILALTENGELVVAQMSPGGYEEISRKQVLDKTCWTTPVVAEGRIYVRNDKGHLVCLAGK